MKFYWFDSNANPASRFGCAILRISPVGKAPVLGTGDQRFESVILNQSKKYERHTQPKSFALQARGHGFESD